MASGSTFAIAGLAITAGGLAITLAVAYLKEKTDTAKHGGKLVEKVDNLVAEFRKLNGSTHDTAKQVTAVEKRVQVFEDICPAFHQLITRGCEAEACETKSEKGDSK